MHAISLHVSPVLHPEARDSVLLVFRTPDAFETERSFPNGLGTQAESHLFHKE